MMRGIHSKAGLVLALGVTLMFSACANPASPSAIAFTSLSESVETSSDVRAETTYVIRDAATLRTVWALVFQGRREAPAIDFSKEMLVIVALGEKATAGYGVSITGVSRRDRGLVVNVTAFAPAAGCDTAAVRTFPVAVSRLRAFDGPVRFDFTRTTRPCGGR
ncbi:MAG TPA: protease complex subunit PrcB family protein [Vicinamibacterales bacterium]|nr:protease complex subunit PrcB family protein [Vicinamibacterales bacterium]